MILLPADQLIFVGVLVLSFIVSSALNLISRVPFSCIPSGHAHIIHAVQIIFGLSFGTLMFGGYDMSIVVGTALWIFLCVRWPSKLTRPLVWATMFSILLYIHYYRPVESLIHVSGCFMLMIIKYTTHANGSSTSKPPTLIEWFGWTFFIPSFFTGPTLTFDEYMNWVTYTTGLDAPICSFPYEIGLDRPYGFGTFEVIVEVLWCVPFAIVGTTLIPVTSVAALNPDTGIIFRLIYAWIALWCVKCRYYLIWGIAEASYITSGASKFVWHRGRNVVIPKIEYAQSVHDITANWNRCASQWLKHSVYQPITAMLDAAGYPIETCGRVAIFITSLTSATWHGFSAGYYMTFGCTFVSTIVARLMHKIVEPTVAQTPSLHFLYKFIMVLWLNIIFITYAMPFQLHTFENCWKYWQSIHFIGHIWTGAALIVVLLVVTNRQTRQIRQIEEKYISKKNI